VSGAYSQPLFEVNVVESCFEECTGSVILVRDKEQYEDDWFWPVEVTLFNEETHAYYEYALNSDIFIIPDICPGNYFLEVDLSATCGFTDELIIVENEEIVIKSTYSINHPSSCASNDGSIRVLQLQTSGGSGALTRIWTDRWGNPIPNLHDLTAGLYILVITDELGCTKRDTLDLRTKMSPNIDYEIKNACSGQDNGSIYALIWNEAGVEDVFNILWSDGVSIGGHSSNEPIERYDLEAGEYCMTITSIYTGCSSMECMNVEETSGSEMYVTTRITHPCEGKSNGMISVGVLGGIPPYSYTWETTDSEYSYASNLGEGRHRVAVEDYCGQTVDLDLYLESLRFETFVTSPSCNEGTIEVMTSGGNRLSYSWHLNGEIVGSTSLLIGVKSGEYCCRIIDFNGCLIDEKCVELVNNDMEVFTSASCSGLKNGFVSVKVFKIPGIVGKLYFSGFETRDISDDITEVVFDNLAPGVYQLDYVVGGCTIRKEVEIMEEYVETRYSHYQEDECVFDWYCSDELVANNIIRETGTIDMENAQGGQLEACKAPVLCRGTNAGSVNFNKENYRVAEFRRILLLLLVSGNSPYDPNVVEERLRDLNRRGYSACDKVRICESNLKFWDLTLIDEDCTGEFEYPISENCWRVECCGTFQSSYDYCLSDIMLEFVDFNRDVEECAMRRMRVIQLVEWHYDILDYEEDYEGSELYVFMEEIISNLELRQKAPCAHVTFCSNDFRIITSDIESIECEHRPACMGEYITVNDETCLRYQCLLQNTCDNCEQFEYTEVICSSFDEERWDVYAYREKEEDQFLFNQSFEYSRFQGFFINYGEDGVFPSAILETNRGNVLYRSRLETRYGQLELVDFDNGYYNVEQDNVVKSRFSQEVEISHHSHEESFEFNAIDMSMDLQASLETGGVLFKGTCRGNVALGSVLIIPSAFDSKNYFEMDLINGSASVRTIVNNPTYSLVDDLKGLNSPFILIGLGDRTEINGELIRTSRNGESIIWDKRADETHISFNLTGELSATNYLYNPVDDLHYIILEGSGTGEFQNSTVVSNGSEIVITAVNKYGQLVWSEKLRASANIGTTYLTFSNYGYVVCVFDFEGNVQGSNLSIQSNGSFDIAVVQLDAIHGNILKSHQYGGAASERVRDIYLSGDKVFIGGDILGEWDITRIGYYNFHNVGNSSETAFLTYHRLDQLKERSQESIDLSFREATNNEISVSPSPASSNLWIRNNLDDEILQIELINSAGDVVRSLDGSDLTHTGVINIDITSLKPSVYRIRFDMISKDPIVKSFVKMN